MGWLRIPRPDPPSRRTAAELHDRLEKIEKDLGLPPRPKKATATADEGLWSRAYEIASADRTLTMGAALSKALDEKVRKMGTNTDARRAYEQIEARASEIRKSDRSLSKERAFVKAAEELPDAYEAAKGYSLPGEPVAKAAPAPIPVAIAKAADAIQARSSLTREQAIVKACEENPELYVQWREAQ